MKKTILSFVIVACAALGSVTNASAGGLGGDLIEIGCGGCGAGRMLDKVHRDIKHANPGYGKAEEQLTNDVRQSIGLPPHCEPLYNKWGEEVSCQ